MLSFMAMDYFQKSPVLLLPLISLGIFLTVFLAAIVRTWLTQDREIEELSRMPLRDGERERHAAPAISQEGHHV
jgi:hypothetical protein